MKTLEDLNDELVEILIEIKHLAVHVEVLNYFSTRPKRIEKIKAFFDDIELELNPGADVYNHLLSKYDFDQYDLDCYQDQPILKRKAKANIYYAQQSIKELSNKTRIYLDYEFLK